MNIFVDIARKCQFNYNLLVVLNDNNNYFVDSIVTIIFDVHECIVP